MLISFFLKNFYKSFLIFFSVLIIIFGASDLFVRLPMISSTSVLPSFFILMLPLMAQFAIPISSCLAILSTIGNLYIEDEIIQVHFFSSARKDLYFVLLIFSLSVLLVYAPIVTSWAPKSYKKGKQLILDLAKQHFADLQPNKFHNLSNNFTLFFEELLKDEEKLEFNKILLMFKEKDADRYLVNAKKGFLYNDNLFLEDGVMRNIGGEKTYIANFKNSQIDLKRFLDFKETKLRIKDLKFFTFSDLREIKEENLQAYIEYHKRIAQIIWQFLFPILSFFLIMLFARKKSNLLTSVFLSGSLFLLSYFLLNIVKTITFFDHFIVILFYFPIFLISFLIFYFYRKFV